jgi:hypothetical protein
VRVAASPVDDGAAWIVAVVALDNEDDPANFVSEAYARDVASRVNRAIALEDKHAD